MGKGREREKERSLKGEREDGREGKGGERERERERERVQQQAHVHMVCTMQLLGSLWDALMLSYLTCWLMNCKYLLLASPPQVLHQRCSAFLWECLPSN